MCVMPVHGSGAGAGPAPGSQAAAAGVECGHLGGDHPRPRPVVGRQLHAVPRGGAQVRDDDVLLLRSENIRYNKLSQAKKDQ